MKPIVDSLKTLGENTKVFESLRDNLFAPKKLKFNSQICTTREQSDKLLALGLKAETADCHYEGRKNKECEWEVAVMGGCYYSWDFPAWSLHRLLCMLPRCVDGGYRL